MKVSVGTDLVHIPTFRMRIERTPTMLNALFTVHELSRSRSMESLAGRFAAKEAALKALGLSPGSWQSLEVQNHSSGKPFISLISINEFPILSQDLSISHDGDYATAVVVVLYKTL